MIKLQLTLQLKLSLLRTNYQRVILIDTYESFSLFVMCSYLHPKTFHRRFYVR